MLRLIIITTTTTLLLLGVDLWLFLINIINYNTNYDLLPHISSHSPNPRHLHPLISLLLLHSLPLRTILSSPRLLLPLLPLPIIHILSLLSPHRLRARAFSRNILLSLPILLGLELLLPLPRQVISPVSGSHQGHPPCHLLTRFHRCIRQQLPLPSDLHLGINLTFSKKKLRSPPLQQQPTL